MSRMQLSEEKHETMHVHPTSTKDGQYTEKLLQAGQLYLAVQDEVRQRILVYPVQPVKYRQC